MSSKIKPSQIKAIKTSMLAFDFEMNISKYRKHDGRIFTMIGEATDIESGLKLIYLVDEKDDLLTFPSSLFDKKILTLSKGMVNRFEKISG